MLVTVNWIRENYIKFNELYFGNTLPMIQFKVSRSKQTWGYASYKYDFQNSTIIPTMISISNYYDSPEDVKKTTLLHEMIHIEDYTFHPEHFIRNGRKISRHYYDAHGWWFKDECKRLKEFGWDIEKYVTEEEKSVSHLSERSVACLENRRNIALICVIHGTDNNWICKTDMNKIYDVVNSVKRIGRQWRWYIGEAKKVKFYTFDNASFAEKRSCATRLTGNRYSIQSTLRFLENMKATDYKSITL